MQAVDRGIYPPLLWGPPTKKAELRAKNLSILTIDGGYGFGNGHVVPALLRGLGDVLVKLRAIFLSQVFSYLLCLLQGGPSANYQTSHLQS